MIATIILGIGCFLTGFGFWLLCMTRDPLGFIPPGASVPFLVGAVMIVIGIVMKAFGL